MIVFGKSSWAALVFLAFTTGSPIYPQQSWRQVAQDLTLAGPDSIDQQTRSARDAFFDARIGANSPLDLPENTPSLNSVWERVGRTPAVITSDDVVAVVNFNSFNCIVSRSKRSIYTEVSMSVEEVLKDTTGTLRRQASIPVLLPGGKVKFPSGKIVTWNIKNDAYEIQPNGRYLIFLTYVKAGEFFLEDKTWRFNDGKVIPNTVEDQIRSQQLVSNYPGLSESTFLSYVRKQLSGIK